MAAGQSVATQSIKMGIMQLTEMSRMREDVISSLTETMSSNENAVISAESSALRNYRDLSGSGPNVVLDPAQVEDVSMQTTHQLNGNDPSVLDADETDHVSETVPFASSFSIDDLSGKDKSFWPTVIILGIIFIALVIVAVIYFALN